MSELLCKCGHGKEWHHHVNCGACSCQLYDAAAEPKTTNRFDFIKESRPPAVKIATNIDGATGISSTVEGFEDVELWASHHHPLWHATSMQAKHANLAEIDRLRLLASNLLATNVELQRHVIATMRTGGHDALAKVKGVEIV